MQIQIDFRSGVPIYTQIMEQIQHKVASGELKPGDQLPTVRQLATDLRVNFNTVARAYRLLDEAGLISTQQGRGTYIWAAAPAESKRQLANKVWQNGPALGRRSQPGGVSRREEIQQALDEAINDSFKPIR